MATLIAANYQSQSSSAYGFMSKDGIKLKNNTLYTLKCRYKWNKNGTSSSHPLAGYLYETTWTNQCGAGYFFYNTPSDYTTYEHKFTTTSSASSYSFSIRCYANGQHNNGVADGAILDVDWYELWEGDATEFSLTDAYAKSENKTASDFVAIGGHPSNTNTCTNSNYFSSSEPREAVRSWMGYYYKTQSTTSYGDWTYSYTGYTSAERSRSVTKYDHYSNGKKVQTSTSTQVEGATLTYGNWSYNWTTTGNSTRSRTVTYTWGDNSTTTKTQTETGGTRYIVLSSEDYANKVPVHTFPANGSGSTTLTTLSHDYWGSTFIAQNTITGVSCSCTGFTCSVSGSTLTITASNLGTTEKEYHKATIVSTKTGFTTRSGYTFVAQEANAATYGVPTFDMVYVGGNGSAGNYAAAGGDSSLTPSIISFNQVVNYTSGSTSNITSTSGATISYKVTASAGAATVTVNSATGVVNVGSLGTTEQAKTYPIRQVQCSITLNGKTGTDEGWIGQEANVRSISSVYFAPYKPDASWIVDVNNGLWATCPASGGYVKASGYVNYTHTSGAALNDQYITGDAQLSWSGSPAWITAHVNGGYRIDSRGTTTGDARSSNATWTYGGKTSGTIKLTQQANSWYDKALQISASPTSIAAAGGTTTFTAKIKRGYTSGSESGWDYNVSTSTSLKYTSNQSWLTITNPNGSASGYGSAGNNKSTSAKTTATVTGTYGGVLTATCTVGQAAGSYSCSITAYGTPTISIGSGITAAGGSATVTASVSNTQTCYWNGVVESTTSVAGTVNLSIQSQYFSTSSSASSGTAITRYSLSGTKLSHSSMAKNVGYDYCTVKATNAGSSSKTATTTTKVQNSVGSYYVSSYGKPTKPTLTSSLTAAGGSATASGSTVTNSTRRDYTSGSYDTSTASGSVSYYVNSQYFSTSASATSGTSISRFSISSSTVSHSTMAKNEGYDYCNVVAKNASDTSKVSDASNTISVQNKKTIGTAKLQASSQNLYSVSGSSPSNVTITYEIYSIDTYSSGATGYTNKSGVTASVSCSSTDQYGYNDTRCGVSRNNATDSSGKGSVVIWTSDNYSGVVYDHSVALSYGGVTRRHTWRQESD